MSHSMNAAVRSFVLAMVGYVVTLVLVVVALRLIPGTPWRVLLALLPVVPVLFGLRAFVHALAQMDELQQRIHLQAIGFAVGALASISVTYGFLELLAGFPTLSWIWFLPLLAGSWGIGLMLATRRYA